MVRLSISLQTWTTQKCRASEVLQQPQKLVFKTDHTKAMSTRLPFSTRRFGSTRASQQSRRLLHLCAATFVLHTWGLGAVGQSELGATALKGRREPISEGSAASLSAKEVHCCSVIRQHSGWLHDARVVVAESATSLASKSPPPPVRLPSTCRRAGWPPAQA